MTFSGGNKLLDSKKIFSTLDIRQGMHIADLGCGGAAHFVIPAAKLVGDTGVIYAVDILKTALESVARSARREGLINIETVWSNLETYGATRIEKESLDAGLLINVLFQTQKHDAVIQEAHRLLKKGGQLLIIDWKMTAAPLGPPTDHRMKQDEIKAICTTLNLRLDSEFEAGPYHFGLLYSK